ncbi:DUF2569 domain-containing protein [Endozoicomonadaceae bacterium StTr2]
MTMDSAKPGDSTKPQDSAKPEPKGLGGWLILVGIGVILGPLRMLGTAWEGFSPLYIEGAWSYLTIPGSAGYNSFIGQLLLGEIIANSLIILASLYLAYLYLGRKALFPKVYITILIASILIIVVDAIISTLVLPEQYHFEEVSQGELIRSVVSAVIWIPYMIHSRRVKNTFTRERHSKELPLLGSVSMATVLVLTMLLVTDTPKTRTPAEVTKAEINPADIVPPQLEQVLKETAENLNRRLPLMIDDDTELYSAIGMEGTMTYLYTVVNHPAEEIDKALFIANMKPQLVDNFCNSEGMVEFRNLNVRVKYSYSGKWGANIATIDVSRQDCLA